MGAMFRIETMGDHAIDLSLGSLIDAFSDLTPFFDEYAGPFLEGDVLTRFETETAPEGSPWEPSIRKLTEGGKTLSDSGQLAASRTFESTRSSLAVGTNKIYAGTHQDGATIRAKSAPFLMFNLPGGLGLRRVKEVEIPARPFLGLSNEARIELPLMAEEYALAAMGGAA